MTDVIFTFSYDSWGDAVHRGMHRPPDRLVTTLLDHERISRLLVANPYRSAPVRMLRSTIGHGEAPFPASRRNGLVTPLRLQRGDPTDVPRLRQSYAGYDEALRRAAAAMGMTLPAVITTHPFIAGFAPLTWARSVLFYVRDDWSAFPDRRRWWGAFRAAYRDVRLSGRPVVTVSQELLERIDPIGPGAVVPNGIEPGEWLGPATAPPAWFEAIPGPRALYVGTIDSRLDVPGLLRLSQRRPDLHVVLVGHQAEPDYIAPLFGQPTIHLHDAVPRSELVPLVRAADVCLIAHRRTPLTEAMSPLKLYEYLAGGRPVLSIDLAPVRGISDRVLLADGVADFADLLDEALALGPAAEDERHAFVVDNSWRARHEQILDLALV